MLYVIAINLGPTSRLTYRIEKNKKAFKKAFFWLQKKNKENY